MIQTTNKKCFFIGRVIFSEFNKNSQNVAHDHIIIIEHLKKNKGYPFG
ncbi:hypothetical protein FM107_10740 [Sphingobacterium sp. JB170]|nr:hypothetical protein FM107_10740 [Sphingobacterium sp. JB170]